MSIQQSCEEKSLGACMHGGFLKINPVLAITKEQADKGLDILDDAIGDLEKTINTRATCCSFSFC